MADQQLLNILLVDDSSDDLELLVTAFHRIGVTNNIRCVNSGFEAIAYILGEGRFSDRELYPYPSFVMTDLKMPDGDGFTLLEHLQGMPQYSIFPTIVMSASADEDDVRTAYRLGASTYLTKPSGFGELVRVLRTLLDLWLVAKLPSVDVTGKQLSTSSAGKLGERFQQLHARTPTGQDAQ